MITPEHIDIIPLCSGWREAVLELRVEGRTEEEAKRNLWRQIFPPDLCHALASLENFLGCARTRALTPFEAQLVVNHVKAIDAHLYPDFS